MGKIIRGVNIPLIPCALMGHFLNPVKHWVTHVNVRRGDIDLRPQCHGTFIHFTTAHPLQHGQIFTDRSIMKRTVSAGTGQRATIFTHLLPVEFTDKGFTLLYQIHRPGVELIKIIRCIAGFSRPIKTEPSNVLNDCINEDLILFFWVCIIKSQITGPTKLFRQPKI